MRKREKGGQKGQGNPTRLPSGNLLLLRVAVTQGVCVCIPPSLPSAPLLPPLLIPLPLLSFPGGGEGEFSWSLTPFYEAPLKARTLKAVGRPLWV